MSITSDRMMALIREQAANQSVTAFTISTDLLGSACMGANTVLARQKNKSANKGLEIS